MTVQNGRPGEMSMKELGEKIYNIAERIYPICRSITGEGVRETLNILSEYTKEMKIYNVPSGTQVFDWTVPKEWKIREAYIEDGIGNRVIDFKNHNLHVMGYSLPVDKWVSKEELLSYIYTQPDQPEVIPYVTSYYKKRFGFCMSQNQKEALPDGRYHMVIDSELIEGNLTYGEIIIPGENKDEILLSTYICHPSMGNNECSGPALAVTLAEYLWKKEKRRYTYRIIFIPETIGSITYLSQHLDWMKEHVKAGFVLSCVGDNRDYSIVESLYGNTIADRVLKNVLKSKTGGGFSTYSFLDRGSDERQYNAPGVDLPVVAFCRSKYGEYPEYHTSADDLSVISAEGFEGAYDVMIQVIEALEFNDKYKVSVLCEPQLGKRGLYPTISQNGNYNEIRAMSDLIAYADGANDLFDISDRIGVPVKKMIPIVKKLKENGLLIQDKLRK